MIRTSTHRSSANALRLRSAFNQTLADVPANRRATYNPNLELSADEQKLIDGAALSLSESSIARILALAAGK